MPENNNRLVAWSGRRSSRQAASHLVDNANALRTLCGRVIEPQTWKYRPSKPGDPTCLLCRKYEREIRP